MISQEDVQYVASLSRIHLKKDEVECLSKDLEKIVDYIKKLESLETANIQPTSHVLPIQNVFREDIIKPSLSQKEALHFSIEQHQGCFKVPKIIE
ncbi:MAG TPA: Asp-tRNA(Asn)/Glu-tRNA(Gln) amidotransferase subunit GatC [Candidatus Omnitrophota bacterium]|nr:Asp-tRNA(Asn)/Glu-tRNA(Gln) amidotransferase subunit GatC [Candidatus Omnitrophota bacterium]HPN88182.1 Asp-tRNA(Asn)/Glu-tRNA(Gln) amidotransferase subunit GatC [Candidatus Omnitrophota bacterium]